MNTPNIRFKRFADDWEQRELGDQMYIKSRIGWQALTKSEYLDTGDYYLITGTDIDEDKHVVDLSRCYYVSKERYEMDDKIQVHEGDIIVTKDGTIGKVAMVTGLNKPATLNSHLFVLRDMSGNLDNRFLLQMLNSHIFDAFVKSTKTGSTLTGLPQKTFVKFKFPAPKLDEQNKISHYLDNIDNLISLHQRKCDALKELKKGMLQKMVPKTGEKVPEIRFAGFTDDWEKRKLGEVFEQTSNFVTPNDDIELWSLTVEDGLTPKTERYNREFLVKKEGNFKEVRPGDIVYNPMNMTLGAVGHNGMDKSVAVSGYYTTMIAKSDNDAYYINTWLKSPQAILLYRTYATGSLIEKQRVQFPTLSEIPASFPEYEEQKRIGSYFSNLDNLIALHQQKCESLKAMKKYMLQNMFPQRK